ALGEIAGPRNEALRLLRLAAARRDDLTRLQERVRYRDRLVEQAAWIVAQVDNVPFQAFAGLRRVLVQRLLDLVRCLLVECRDPDVGDVALQSRPDRMHGDSLADDRQLDRLLLAL